MSSVLLRGGGEARNSSLSHDSFRGQMSWEKVCGQDCRRCPDKKGIGVRLKQIDGGEFRVML